jgi:multiple sugar transport system permease protein
MNPKLKRTLERIFLLYVPLAIMLAYITFPILWTLKSSFQTERALARRPLQYWPKPWTFENYRYVWSALKFARYFLNTGLVAAGSVASVIGVTLLAGYAMARYDFILRKPMLAAFLGLRMFPGVVILIPYVVLFYRLKLNDKLVSLVLANLAGGIPMGTLMIRGFINGVPIELEEAARIDGANRWQIIGRVIFPLIRPGIVTVSILTFVGAWNALLLPVLLMNDDDMYTIAVGLAYLRGEFRIEWAAINAGAIIALIPAFALFLSIQRHLVHGLAGALKF